MDIAKIIFNTYFEYNRSRQPKIQGMKPPEPIPYSELEVRGLIDRIVNDVNSRLAILYFEEK